MNWTWNIRSRDGAMNGLEFALATTAGGHSKVLIHAAPMYASVEVTTSEGQLVGRGDVDRDGEYSPMTLIELDEGGFRRSEVWPDESLYGTPVILAGGEVGILREWFNADDHKWWQWNIEFSNHVGRPADWSPPTRKG